MITMNGINIASMIVTSMVQIDMSELKIPMITVYEKLIEAPEKYIAWLWDASVPAPTNAIILRDTLEDIREDIKAAGFTVCFGRADCDAKQIVESWMK